MHEVASRGSALSHRRHAAVAAGKPPLILMPDAREEEQDMIAALRAGGGKGEVHTLLPPRPVYSGRRFRRLRWFHQVGERIDPASFGDALWHVERFILDLLEQDDSTLPILIASGQGAAVASALAPHLTERAAGMILLNASAGQSMPVTASMPVVSIAREEGSAGIVAALNIMLNQGEGSAHG